jgi:membrane protein YqaA with SNARE-associated domain
LGAADSGELIAARDLLSKRGVGVFGRTLIGIFLSAGGLFVLAASESTVFFWFPFGVDAAVILLVARNVDRAWLYPVIATAGSVLGTAFTLWMGKKIGEAGIARYVPEKRLKAATAKVKSKGAAAIALLGIVPPPFPFTPFVLVSGALKVSFRRFLTALTAVRLARFGAEAVIAARFGRRAIRWLNSDILQFIVGALIVLAVAGIAVGVYGLVRPRPLAAR